MFQKHYHFIHCAQHKLFLTLYSNVTTVFTVIRLRTERSRNLDLECQQRRHFVFSPLLWQTLENTQPPQRWLLGAFVGKTPEREAYFLLSSSFKVKNAWSYASTPPYIIMPWCLFTHRYILHLCVCNIRLSRSWHFMRLTFVSPQLGACLSSQCCTQTMQCVLPGLYTQKTHRHATFVTVAVCSFVSDRVLFFSFLLVIDKDFLSNPQRRWDFNPNFCERTQTVHLQYP